MESEAHQFENVKHKQLLLSKSIEDRQIDNSKTIIEELASFHSQCPHSLNWYLYPHPHSSPLLHAIVKGQQEIALHLLKYGCDPHTDSGLHTFSTIKTSETKMSKSLFRVLEKPGFEKVFFKILEKADKLTVDKNGDTVLHIIAKRKLCSMFEVVLTSRWLLKMTKHANNQGYLPLHLAANSNFVQFFQILYQSLSPTEVFGSSLYCDEEQENLLNQSFDLAGYITEAAVGINTQALVKKTTALHLAASERSLQMVQILLKLGADVNASDEAGKTPLVECLDQRGERNVIASSLFDIYQVCKVLLQAGANVNVKSTIRYSERRSMANDDTLSPLHLAAGIGSKDVVEILLNNGANPCQLSGDIGKIPVQFALEQGHNEAALVLLNDELYPSGFLASHLDYAFNSLLHYADRCSSEVIKKLIDLSCPLDRPNVNHLRPLDKAISSRNISFVELLLNVQPSIVNVHVYQDPNAYPPLHLAASSGNVPLCQLLLSHGADIYARPYGKHRAYRKAFKFNRYDIAVLLCEQMSRPFSLLEREELILQEQTLQCVKPDLAVRLRTRLDEVPTLVLTCLDVIRNVFIRTHLSFKNIHLLPVPETVIKALKYQNLKTDY
ncbi:ankyrin-1-like [Biomphalaria glabrata]|uniref:Ankyrin-1-like n=1 Tax=Biomphalaria glabrata TaxID=6526 RepID=A0A9U8E3I7_BIOGL|nr:ankyrin-1-like [Biomphalaria glabrata]